jgi:hypothetical protein
MPTALAQCGSNAIVCENFNAGAPRSEWDVTGAGDLSIQGFATEMSVNRGETVRFKVKTDASSYQLAIYRMGYYGGSGARRIATINPTAALPQAQPSCLSDPATGLVDCGNWQESASWPVPAGATSGIYFAKLTRGDTGGGSHILFIVRDDAGHSDLVFQTSDSTWQAYNQYEGKSLYTGGPGTNPARAYKVSYNRPITTRGTNPDSSVFNAEYPMVRWLEANGYDVSYVSGIDTDRRGAAALNPQAHKAFLSVGRDEYWSAAQRANVEAARNAGLSLAFFSGKEIFWKARWEASIDGTNTPFRTLVSYKETYANAKIDPAGPSIWTGTWRDPRFSPPADGGRPENALSGTISTVECCLTNPTISVPAAAATLPFWRNTPIAATGGGLLSPRQAGPSVANGGLLGSAWDEDLDNGSRPAGLLQLSTTNRSVPAKLQNLGSAYAAGFATHTMTLYRHTSGALVFGAGTMQWSWGLDNSHDRLPDTTSDYTNLSVQQATVNLLADMSAQPLTLQAGLTLAAAAGDLAPPASTITLPSAGATVIHNAGMTISGTAVDAGGKVALVEVSVDGGNTWKPAIGRESWTYSWGVTSTGPLVLKTRATDQYGNVETPGAGTPVTAITVTCPCSLWNPALTVPAVIDDGDAQPVELGVKFRSDANAFLYGLRFYKSASNTGTHVGRVYSSAGVLLASATFTSETPSGWQQVLFSNPILLSANTTYVASYHTAAGHYSASPGYFATLGVDAAPLHAPSNVTTLNGVYAYGAGGFPTFSYNATNYWVDVIVGFSLGEGGAPVPPVVTAVTPAPATTGVALGTSARVTFSKAIAPATISASTIELRDAAGAPVPGAVFYDATTRTATFDPAGSLAPSSIYTLVVRGGTSGPHVSDSSGVALASDFTSSFTTLGGTTGCPCTIWPSSAVPGVIDSGDGDGVELGVKFRSDADGFISGVRFYKSAANTGTHLANLWTDGGALLATATFTGETASGWQEATFAAPVPITANAQYVASYHTSTGHYSVDDGAFALGAVDTPPLHAAGDAAGGNGVYRYGASGFPASSYRASNYWVDVVFNTTAGPDLTPPTVLTTAPAGNATTVSATVIVTATFSEAVDPATVTTGTFELRDAGNTLVTATIGYNAATRTATLTPGAPLAPNATYTARLRGGAADPRIKDAAGNALASDAVWSFTTAGPLFCPCTIWPGSAVPALIDSGDGNPVEVGVKFRADIDGLISGLRFYKSAANVGTHVGHLWTASGTLLATATFTGETASGWQQVNFSTPVPITANTQYVASYYTSAGHYSVGRFFFASGVDRPPLHALSDAAGGNGVYRYGPSGFPFSSFNASNYWVDVVFTTSTGADVTPPTVVTTTPSDGASFVSPTTSVSASFSEAINAATVTTSTFELRTAANAVVPATVSYNASNGTATLAPAVPLSADATYTARLRGGPLDPAVEDVSGNALAADVSWSFTVGSLTTAFVDTSVADFSKGTLGPGGEIGAAGGGDLSLAPWVSEEFNGVALPAGWAMSPWIGTPSATVALGAISVDGALVGTTSTYRAPIASLEFTATFSGMPYQHAGFGVTFTEGVWAIFSTGGGDGLYARSNNGGTARDTLIPGTWVGAPHRFRIDWSASSVVYFIDGVQVASHAVAIGAMMRPLASDYVGEGSALKIDSMRMTPYSAAATFVSGVFDAAAAVTWTSAAWTGATPPGTAVTLSVRYGSTPVPDGSWTAFTPVTGAIDGVGRYLQYRLQLSSSEFTAAPVVNDVTVNFRR